MKQVYEAKIYADAHLYDINGEGERGSSWDMVEAASTMADLLEAIEQATDTNRKDWDTEQLNGYAHATEIFASNVVDVDNCKASKKDIELWENGQKQLWLANYHILISKCTYSPVDMETVANLI